jgi:uncharacterized paraquat-inducible protein A
VRQVPKWGRGSRSGGFGLRVFTEFVLHRPLAVAHNRQWFRRNRAEGQPMSLEVCPECQHIIQSDVAACPHCGQRFRETLAQRLLRYFVRLLLVLTAIAAVAGVVFYLLPRGELSPPG